MFLTQNQAAARLGCSVSKVKRLRLTGKLPYIPGRPPVIEDVDLDAHVATLNQPPPERAPPNTEEPRKAQRDEIWLRVQRKWLRRNFKARSAARLREPN